MNIDARIEALTHSVELLATFQADAAAAYEERSLRFDERLLEMAEQHDREMAEIRRELGRGASASVQEAQLERKCRQELAADMTKRHQELEALLKEFLERGGGNGKR
jgi:hypothetical protein